MEIFFCKEAFGMSFISLFFFLIFIETFFSIIEITDSVKGSLREGQERKSKRGPPFLGE
jgi:hypothetical protein